MTGAVVHRVRALRGGAAGHGPVAYWMSRDQRVADNWALLFAQDLARRLRTPLAVVFSLSPTFLGATLRQYDFMLRGLQLVEQDLGRLHIPFFLLIGSPVETVPSFLSRHGVGALVTDFSPLRIHRAWKGGVIRRISVPFHEVDAHNIVPCWIASGKREYSAATFRPKLHRLLPVFLEDFPNLQRASRRWKGTVPPGPWSRAFESLRGNDRPQPRSAPVPGEEAAHAALRGFLKEGLRIYDRSRNDPNTSSQSGLSPYLHFGQIAAQRVALEVMKSKAGTSPRDAFLEELIVRRELSDNFCLYEHRYDSPEAFPAWARATLDAHSADPRPYVYSRRELEQGATHDPLWNAAQREMVLTGKMHGYLRMYWAKKILEWSATPADALRRAIFLNNRYELDGRDPNGYAGIAWSIGGVHDRAWGERPVIGKIRSMTYEGCRRKFDVEKYVNRIRNLEQGVEAFDSRGQE